MNSRNDLNKHECNQEITVAEIQQAMNSFKNNKSPNNDVLTVEFYKTFNEILKADLHKCTLKFPN